MKALDHAHVAPLHIRDEHTNPTAFGQHEQPLEQRAAQSVVLPGVFDDQSDFGARSVGGCRAIGERDDMVRLADGSRHEAEPSWATLE
jgi:hypothetical protein